MAKMAASIKGSDNILLARTLGCKYSGRDMFRMKRNHTKIWKIICLSSEVMDRHTTWMVGDGTHIDVAEDAWIGSTTSENWPTYYNIDALPTHVSNLLTENHSWNVQLLHEIFSQEMTNTILKLPRDYNGGSDQLVWAHTEKEYMKAAAIHCLECKNPILAGVEIWRLKT